MNLFKSAIATCLIAPLMLIGFSAPSLANAVNHISLQVAQNTNPKTYTTVQDLNNIAIQITEGEFRFRGIIKRSASRQFMGSDGKVRVLLNPYDGHIIVFSEATGEEFYNYYISPVSGVGEDPDTMCDPSKEPC